MKTSAQGQSFLDSFFLPVSLYLEQSLGSSKASTDICGVNEQMTEPPNTRVTGWGGLWGITSHGGKSRCSLPITWGTSVGGEAGRTVTLLSFYAILCHLLD